MHVHPYLFLNGNCEEAAAFYARAVGAEILFMARFSEGPEPVDPAMVPGGDMNKVMHMTLKIGDTMVMASDGGCGAPATFEGFALSLNLTETGEADRAFAALGEGGKIDMPLEKTFFSLKFGMLTDRFGVHWMIHVEDPAMAAA